MVTSAVYLERVYAGILGKMAGVYLGRPVEGWSKQAIADLGEITGFLHDRVGVPLVVADDDLSGTFTFLRALPDHGYPLGVTPQQVAHTWLNYIVPERSVLWWGGLGNSTEHTAYLRLRAGVPAPASGSLALNGSIVAEQIGAQIFIDGWAMVCPGDPARAADLARRAASVSHDGEAIYAAQLIAALEAAAFTESDLERLLDLGLAQIPTDCTIARLAGELRALRATQPDWQAARGWLGTHYGYDRYPGNCHVVPNHGVVLLALLWGNGDLGRAITIATMCGWDTDCNAGNVGCLLGIRGGLAAFTGPYDWRSPMNDQLYLPTADGGRAVTDALREAIAVANCGRALAGAPPLRPTGGARFAFCLPGATQGFVASPGLRLTNPRGEGLVLAWESPGATERSGDQASLLPAAAGRDEPTAIGYRLLAMAPVFTPPEALTMPGYELLACPALYPGQVVRAHVHANTPMTCYLAVQTYGPDDTLTPLLGPAVALTPDLPAELVWQVPATGGAPVAAVGLAIEPVTPGTCTLTGLDWGGTPEARLSPPGRGSLAWRKAWIDAVDRLTLQDDGCLKLVQNTGRGLLIQGVREWRDLVAEATLRVTLARAVGLAVRVQGLRRYLAVLLGADNIVRLIRVVDGNETIITEAPMPWAVGRAYRLGLAIYGTTAQAWVDGEHLFTAEEATGTLEEGAIAVVVEEGCAEAREVWVRP